MNIPTQNAPTKQPGASVRKRLEVFARSFPPFSPTERVIFTILGAILVISAVFVVRGLNNNFLVEVPKTGGALTEGIIGTPRFINPVLAISDADRDLTALTYSGLLKAAPDGKLLPDLAEKVNISEDGLKYIFTLKENITFHDGEPVTADDVVFTIGRIQDPAIKSPRRANWEGVSVEKTGEREIKMTLKQAYSPFLQNATIGILPAHIWKNVEPEMFPFSEYNIKPIGSGPFALKEIKRNADAPVSYELQPFRNYALNRPYLKTLRVRFYPSEDKLLDAYKAGEIEAASAISPANVGSLRFNQMSLLQSPLPRVFGVFFNQNEAKIFNNKEVRKALNAAVDKEKIVREILSGYATAIDSPIPPGIIEEYDTNRATTTRPADLIAEAARILQQNGWKKGDDGVYSRTIKKNTERLSFTLSTSDTAELKTVAEFLKKTWTELGAEAELKIFEPGNLNQNVIRPRQYDALLFGEIVGRDLDLFAFWHSSQRNDPGLNIALYTNIKTDKLLEEARSIADTAERMKKYRAFEEEILSDTPAVFLYAPDFIYILPRRIKGVELGYMTAPSDRFANIERWYAETEKVWKVFAKDNNAAKTSN